MAKKPPIPSIREQRAEFLINWFLDVFANRKAPFPRKCFDGIAVHMEDWLKAGGRYNRQVERREKYR